MTAESTSNGVSDEVAEPMGTPAEPVPMIARTTRSPARSPTPEPSMPTATGHKHTAKRNAKPKHSPRRYRNAAPTAAPRMTASRREATPPQPTKKQTFTSLLQTLGGAAATSVLGAYAVKWGLHPELVSAGLGVAGGYFAWQSPSDFNRHVGGGAASAAASQWLLLKFAAAPAAPKPAAPIPAPAPQPQLPRPRSADVGSLPPGMLDAAFERARAELAVTGDGYPPDYAHHHQANEHLHHGP